MNLIKTSNYKPSLLTDFFKDSFFDDIFQPLQIRNVNVGPATNITENEKEIVMDVALPGLRRSDVKISVEKGQLNIAYEQEIKNETKNDNLVRKEFSFSSFSRSFTLPDNVNEESITSKLENGILKINIPKLEEKKKETKFIDIQ